MFPSFEIRNQFKPLMINHFKNQGEVWCMILKTEKYAVSNKGRVKNVFTNKILSPGVRHGYHLVRLSMYPGKFKTFLVHRLVAMTYFPTVHMEHLEVNHIDGNKSNNTIENLEWTTRSENQQHAVRTGLCKNTGAKRKYQTDLVDEMIEYYKIGFSFQEIGRAFNVNLNGIDTLLKRRMNENK